MDSKVSRSTAPWLDRQGEAPGLADLTGDVRLMVKGEVAGVLRLDHGRVSIAPTGDASALVAVDSETTLLRLLAGVEHPFVAYLLGRLRAEGDRALALRTLLGLRGGSPWTSITEAKAA